VKTYLCQAAWLTRREEVKAVREKEEKRYELSNPAVVVVVMVVSCR
jgi:hypothetical protein